MGTRIEPHGWQRRRAKQLKRRQGGERKRESIFSLTEKPNACFKAIPSRMAAPRERKRHRARERALHFRGKPNNSSKNGAAGERLLCHCRLFLFHDFTNTTARKKKAVESYCNIYTLDIFCTLKKSSVRPSNGVRILSYHTSDVVSTCDRNLIPRLEWRESLVRTCVTPVTKVLVCLYVCARVRACIHASEHTQRKPESISSIAATASGLGVP